MNFLVFGSNGMAGHLISLYLNEQGHDVTGFALTKSRFVKTIVGDATNCLAVREAVGVNSFDSIINCIGVLNEFAEEDKANAVYLNSFFPHYLAQLTMGTDTQIIHMSTDCVFSGRRGQYAEYDFRDGESFYDRSKALGELEDTENITLRNSIVGPDINPDGIGLLNWFMHQSETVNGFVNAIWTGQTTLQLAKTMEKVAKERATGLYNAVPQESISKYELLCLFSKYLRDNRITVNPVECNSVDKSLIRTNWNSEFTVPDYEMMISELAQWIQDHHTLYAHYY